MYVNTTACHAAVQKDTQCTHHGDTGDNTQSTHTGHSRRIGLAYPDEYTLRVLTDTAPTTAHWVAIQTTTHKQRSGQSTHTDPG